MRFNAIRPFIQIGIFILFFIVPLFDIFRMDLMKLRFFVLRKSFAYNEGYILLICVFLMVFTFLAISKWFGRRFCGWMCPHNTFSLIINKILRLESLKNKSILNKGIEIILSILIAPIIAYCLISYFFDPISLFEEVVSLKWKSWPVISYIILVFIFFAMVYLQRTVFCRVACPYGMFQMCFADKSSRSGGLKNMFKGPGLVLLILLVSLISLLGFTINSTVGFAATIGKQLQGIPTGNYLTYTYTLKIQNNHEKPMTYSVEYTGIPSSWEVQVPDRLVVEPTATHAETLVFKIDKGSANQTYPIIINITSADSRMIEKKLNIFPVETK